MSEWIVSAETIDDFVDGMFSIVAKIVHCEDCKHFILSDGFCTLHESCVSSDAFCSYGERRSE